jgi:pimeloyl-ACP methyl ester carboxylesterase
MNPDAGSDVRLPSAVGYIDDLHPVPSINFQLNRWLSYLGPQALTELRQLTPMLTDLPAYRREFLLAADRALSEGRTLAAAYYYRSAEFFMWRDDPAKQPTREKFLRLVTEHFGIVPSDHHSIPYRSGTVPASLHAYRFSPKESKDTIVLFGGGDSYIEEFLPVVLQLREQGYDIICFEGPGQGRVLEEEGMPMKPEWHEPVAAVLDHFGLTDVTLIGVSMGGGLALRAAAREPRVKRVIAYGIYLDPTRMRRRAPALARLVLGTLFSLRLRRLYDALVQRVMKQNPHIEWIFQQGMHILGTTSPFEYAERARQYGTRDVSSLVQQDVLLLSGTEDFIVPVQQFYWQIEALTNTKSLTARLFTRADHAQNHCQVGNLPLALDVIADWIDFTRSHAHPAPDEAMTQMRT